MSEPKQWSDARMRRHQKAQSHLMKAGAITGLSALGLKGGGQLAIKQGSRAKNIRLSRVGERADRASSAAMYTSMGIGGATGLHGSAVTAQVARKRNTVKKSFSEVAKRNYNPEASRQKRLDRYEQGATATAGALGAGAAIEGARAVSGVRLRREPKKFKHLSDRDKAVMNETRRMDAERKGTKFKPYGGEKVVGKKPIPNFTGTIKANRAANAGVLAAGSIGAAVAADRIRSYKKKPTAGTYAPRYRGIG